MGYCKQSYIVLYERVRNALRNEPDLAMDQLVLRFGCSQAIIRKARSELGINVRGHTEYLQPRDMQKAKSAGTFAYGNDFPYQPHRK